MEEKAGAASVSFQDIEKEILISLRGFLRAWAFSVKLYIFELRLGSFLFCSVLFGLIPGAEEQTPGSVLGSECSITEL